MDVSNLAIVLMFFWQRASCDKLTSWSVKKVGRQLLTKQNGFTYLIMASKLQIIERITPQRILKTSMSCNAMFLSMWCQVVYNKITSLVHLFLSIISTFGTHKIKNEVKENYKREGEVKKFSQNPLAYLIRTCMHIYVLHNTSTKLSGKHGTAPKRRLRLTLNVKTWWREQTEHWGLNLSKIALEWKGLTK